MIRDRWIGPTPCEAGACVQVKWQTAAGCPGVSFTRTGPCRCRVLVRDSKDPAGPMLSFTPAEWSAFTAAIRAGQLDPPGHEHEDAPGDAPGEGTGDGTQ
jgi:hypothetical protein